MSAFKGTAWPWFRRGSLVGSDRRKIADVKVLDAEGEANAKLITAAPALYAALERISRPHDCGCLPCTGSCASEMGLQITVDEMRQLARDAIQSATA